MGARSHLRTVRRSVLAGVLFLAVLAPRAGGESAAGAMSSRRMRFKTKADPAKYAIDSAAAPEQPEVSHGQEPPQGNPKCSLCRQHAQDMEKDWQPQKQQKVKWTKGNVSRATGLFVLGGFECYYCFAVRRKTFSSMSVEDVENTFADEPEKRDQFDLERRLRVRGEQNSASKGTVKAEVVEKKTEYARQFVRSHFYTVDAYIKLMRGPSNLMTLKAKASPWLNRD